MRQVLVHARATGDGRPYRVFFRHSRFQGVKWIIPKKITQELFDGEVKAVLFVNSLDTFPCIYKACQISFRAAFWEPENVHVTVISHKQPVSVWMEYHCRRKCSFLVAEVVKPVLSNSLLCLDIPDTDKPFSVRCCE